MSLTPTGAVVSAFDRLNMATAKGKAVEEQKLSVLQARENRINQILLEKILPDITSNVCLDAIRLNGIMKVRIVFNAFGEGNKDGEFSNELEPSIVINISEYVTEAEGKKIEQTLKKTIKPQNSKHTYDFYKKIHQICLLVSNCVQSLPLDSQGKINKFEDLEQNEKGLFNSFSSFQSQDFEGGNYPLDSIVAAEQDYADMQPNTVSIDARVEEIFIGTNKHSAFYMLLSELGNGNIGEGKKRGIMRIVFNPSEETQNKQPQTIVGAQYFVENIPNVRFLEIPDYIKGISEKLGGMMPDCSYRTMNSEYNDCTPYYTSATWNSKTSQVEVLADFDLSKIN